MENEQSMSGRSRIVDCIYVLFSCLSGWWQAWCVNYGRDSILIPILMSLPFALASYAHATFPVTGTVPERPDWKRALILWAGMPLSLAVGSLTILAESGIMSAAGLGIDNLPFYSVRLVVGEGTACLAWTACLLLWSRQSRFHPSRGILFAVFAVLYAGVLLAHGLSEVIRRNFHKDLFFLLTSIVATMISALILLFLRGKAQEAGSGDIIFGR
jgi:hypothetical protein